MQPTNQTAQFWLRALVQVSEACFDTSALYSALFGLMGQQVALWGWELSGLVH